MLEKLTTGQRKTDEEMFFLVWDKLNEAIDVITRLEEENKGFKFAINNLAKVLNPERKHQLFELIQADIPISKSDHQHDFQEHFSGAQTNWNFGDLEILATFRHTLSRCSCGAFKGEPMWIDDPHV